MFLGSAIVDGRLPRMRNGIIFLFADNILTLKIKFRLLDFCLIFTITCAPVRTALTRSKMYELDVDSRQIKCHYPKSHNSNETNLE